MSIKHLLDTLAATSSRNEKLDILRNNSNNSDNELLKRVIQHALDPFTNYFIRKIPAYIPAQPNQADSLDSVISSLYRLSEREVTGNAAIDYLTKLLSSLTADDAVVLERIIDKDLRCGVSDSTVNKVWDELISVFPCMLASAYDIKLINALPFPALAQIKMDGMRFNAIVRNSKVEYRSRNGKFLNLRGNLDQHFITAANGEDVVFDGELLIKKDGKVAARQIGNGILSKANKGTITEDEARLVHATVWDIIPYADFVRGVCKTPYSVRLAKLAAMSLGHRIALVESTVVHDLSEAQALFKRLLSEGQEGIILKSLNGIWENKRAKHQIKFKGVFDCDLRIVGWEAGTGKNAGRLGALPLESEDGLIKVSVGTGFSDRQRDTITKEMIGQICALEFNGIVQDVRTGVYSLFLPSFKEIRFDKNRADTFEEIKAACNPALKKD